MQLVDTQSIWPEQFQREAERIQGALGSRALSIDHVGSTSVPGLAAKPIIDIDCSKDLKSALFRDRGHHHAEQVGETDSEDRFADTLVEALHGCTRVGLSEEDDDEERRECGGDVPPAGARCRGAGHDHDHGEQA